MLEVGSVESVVEVTGAAPVVTTVGMEVNDLRDALRIQQLLLNGRAITNLFDLTPGVEGGGRPRLFGSRQPLRPFHPFVGAEQGFRRRFWLPRPGSTDAGGSSQALPAR
jgi:hypothetical protein